MSFWCSLMLGEYSVKKGDSMSERVVVPPEMLAAVVRHIEEVQGYQSFRGRPDIKAAVEAALLWLSENPIVPTDEQCDALYRGTSGMLRTTQYIAVEWQRRMFRAPDPEVPEAVKDLLDYPDAASAIDKRVLEAYRRGLRGKPDVP